MCEKKMRQVMTEAHHHIKKPGRPDCPVFLPVSNLLRVQNFINCYGAGTPSLIASARSLIVVIPRFSASSRLIMIV